MMEERKVPALRFQGFTDEWEAQLFGSFAARESKAQISSKAYPCVEYEDIIAGEGVLNKDVRSKGISKKGIKFDNTMVLYGKLRPYLHNMLVPEFSGVAVGDWWVLKPGNVNRRFLYTLLQTKEFDDKANQSSGSKMPRADWNLISRSAFYIPNLSEEQSKIGAAFANLDWLIFSCKEQLAKLQAFKKSMLEKMFPRPGEKVPEVRFRGFTGDWEIHELNSYLEPSKEKNTFGNYTKDDVLSVSGDFGVVKQIQFQGRSFAGASVLNYGVVHTDDIIYTKSPLKANPYGIIKTNSGMAGIVSTLYAVYRPKNGVVSKFIECYFDDDYRLNKYLHPLVNKGAKNDMKISSEKALQGEVIFPPSIEEQLAIAQTISAIEKVIMLCQRKLEKLQSLKQAMLSEMFI